MSFVNLMGNDTFTSAQIDKRVVALIRQQYKIDDEQYYSRILHGQALGTYTPTADELAEVGAYQVHVEQCRELGRQARADNALLLSAIGYEQATQRLAQYRLADGRAEQLAQDAVYDEITGELVSEAASYIAPIEPLPATVEQAVYDADGTQTSTEIVPNPAIVQDDAERAEAQAVIDSANAAVLDAVVMRAAA